jgi:hypothetical protein
MYHKWLITVQTVQIAIPMLRTRKLSDTTAVNAMLMQSSQKPNAVLVSSVRNHAEVCKSWGTEKIYNIRFI